MIKLLLNIIVVYASGFHQQVLAEDLNLIIKKFCMESFNQEMIASGYQENKQVGSQICNCFVYEINNGNTIGQARKTCKEDALKTVDLQKTNLL